MDPVTILALANGATTLLEALAPAIQAAVASGQISVEAQQTLQARVAALPNGFNGPEWKPSTAA